ncbi:MAG TPA: hypothetical protein DCP92_25245 [Nitrospiraceae bacterium]|nr:hypothetical protein [Nitrospiraceae bacterium]
MSLELRPFQSTSWKQPSSGGGRGKNETPQPIPTPTPDGGIALGTPFEQISEDWVRPTPGESKYMFGENIVYS